MITIAASAVAMACQQCGGRLVLDDTQSLVYCERCLTRIFDPTVIVVLFGVDRDDVEKEEWRGTFADFAKANEDAYDAEALAGIADALTSRGEHWCGGGAAPVYVLRIAQAEGR